MKTEIRDNCGNQIRGLVTFTYHGFRISLSQMHGFPELRIFGDTVQPGRDMTERITGSDNSMIGSADGVRRAVEMIDSYWDGMGTRESRKQVASELLVSN